MKGIFKNILEGKNKIVIDYSALIRLADNFVLEEIADVIISNQIELILSRGFNYNHNSYINTAKARQDERVNAINEFLDRIKNSQLVILSQALTFEELLSDTIHDRSSILILSRKSLLLERIREMNFRGDMSVCIVSDHDCKTYIDIRSCLINEAPYSINILSRSSDYLDVEIHCNVGDKVYDFEGNPIVLRDKISTGAEGIVFNTEDENQVAKIYHKAVITPLRWRKLTRMTQAGLAADGVCWPTKLLYTFNRVPVGYLMPKAKGKTLGSVFDGPEAINKVFSGWNRLSVVKTAMSVLEKVLFLHLFGVIIGDIQLKNMMIQNPENVFMIDMDSVQFEDLPCPVGTEEYTPPELWDYSFSALLREPIHEDYSCGILVFSLLFCGQHPYAQRHGKETLREEMQTLSFPYSMDDEKNDMIPVGGYDKIWNALPDGLKEMFILAFSKGQRFQPQEWFAALDSYANALEDGKIKDIEAYELFPYTDTSISEKEMPRTYYKKTIREAIIHSPSDSKEGIDIAITPSKVLRYKSSEDKVFSTDHNQKRDSFGNSFSKNMDQLNSEYLSFSDHRVPDRRSNTQNKSSINSLKDILMNKRIIILLSIFLVLVILIIIASVLLR